MENQLSNKELRGIYNEYFEIFINYQISLSENIFQALLSTYFLDGFPDNVPEELKKAIEYNLENIEDIVSLYFAHVKGIDYKLKNTLIDDKTKIYLNLIKKNPPLILDIYTQAMMLFLRKGEYEFHKQKLDGQKNIEFIEMSSKELFLVDFNSIIFSKCLVTSISQLESFISDTIKIIIKICPNVLKTEKKAINYEELFSNSFEDLKIKVIEKYLYDFSFDSLVVQLEKLKKFGIVIEYHKNSKELINIAEQVRHIVVHNNGRINQKFLDNIYNKSTKLKLKLGEKYQIDLAFIRDVNALIEFLMDEIYKLVKKKFFKGILEEKK